MHIYIYVCLYILMHIYIYIYTDIHHIYIYTNNKFSSNTCIYIYIIYIHIYIYNVLYEISFQYVMLLYMCIYISYWQKFKLTRTHTYIAHVLMHLPKDRFVKKYSVSVSQEKQSEVNVPFVFVSKREMADEYSMSEHLVSYTCMCVLCGCATYMCATSFPAGRTSSWSYTRLSKIQMNASGWVHHGLHNMSPQHIGQVALVQGQHLDLLHGNAGAWQQEVLRQHLILLVCMHVAHPCMCTL